MKQDDRRSRRDFIKTTSVAAAGLTLGGLPAYSTGRVRGANDRIRVAIIGAGDRMMSSLVPAFMASAEAMNFELVAVCDIWKHHRETNTAKIAANTKYKAKAKEIATARNTDELYAMKNIDAVIIATADFQHAYHATEAVRAGKDVYAEKPFANIMSDAREALKVIGGSKQVFQVGTQRRSTTSYMRAKEYLDSGRFGDIVMAEMTWNVNQPGRWRRPNVVPLMKEQDTDWKRFLINRDPKIPFDARKHLEFRLFWPFSSGIPDQWMVHQIDTVHWFTGIHHPTSVVASGGIYLWKDGRTNFDTMTAVFEYNNPKTNKGFQVLYTSRQTNEAGGVKEIYYSNGGTLNLDTNKVGPEGGLTERYAREMNMKANLLEPLTLTDEGGIETAANTGVDKQTVAHMRNWMECVRNRNQKTNADIQAAYDHSVALCMTIAALHTGKKVTFDDKRQDVVLS
ncbi:MAG TPA: Gfo/Idh/MocA family oxidoreductase [Blastocatellia bacterium]|nr:Gfo/Idh/MocA family oxidoreductase [Blastocatellia bacterium]